MKYIGKNTTFHTKVRFLKKRTREILKKLINDIFMHIVFILVRKQLGVTVEILKKGYLKLLKCVK